MSDYRKFLIVPGVCAVLAIFAGVLIFALSLYQSPSLALALFTYIGGLIALFVGVGSLICIIKEWINS